VKCPSWTSPSFTPLFHRLDVIVNRLLGVHPRDVAPAGSMSSIVSKARYGLIAPARSRSEARNGATRAARRSRDEADLRPRPLANQMVVHSARYCEQGRDRRMVLVDGRSERMSTRSRWRSPAGLPAAPESPAAARRAFLGLYSVARDGLEAPIRRPSSWRSLSSSSFFQIGHFKLDLPARRGRRMEQVKLRPDGRVH